MTSTATPVAAAGGDAAQQPREPAFEDLAHSVDEAARAVADLDGPARQAAQELRAAIEAAHRAALITIVRRLRAEPGGQEILFELVDDPLVRMLFSLHGIIRPDPVTEATRVLAAMRPRLQSRGGDVELVRIEGGTAYLRLHGACDGGSMAAVTMREEVVRALVAGVPAVTTVEVLAGEPAPVLIPLSALRRRDDATPEPGWVKTLTAGDVPEGAITQLRLVAVTGTEQDVIVVRIDGRMTAYKDECAHQGLPLGGGLLDPSAGTLTCPWHGYCYDALSGECMSAPGAALQQLPLRIEDEHVWIRVG